MTSTTLASLALAAWLMVAAGMSKHRLEFRPPRPRRWGRRRLR